MSSYSRRDLEKMAKEIIDTHTGTGCKPKDALIDTLKDRDMNEEQIKRLVELSNTALFLDKFQNTSGSKDRFIDFDIIDPEDIMHSMSQGGGSKSHKSVTMSITTPKGTSVRRVVDNNPGLDTDRSWFFDDAPNEKVASCKDVPLDFDVQGREKVASTQKERSPFNDAKLEESLHTKVAEAKIYCDELASNIAGKYKDIYSREKYAAYEQDALALFGPQATYALQAVRIKLGMPLLRAMPTEDMVKEAADRHIASKNTPGIVETGLFLENLQSFIKVSRALVPFDKTAAIGTEALLAAGTAIMGRDFVQPITSAYGYDLATKYGPSAFYRVKGYDRMMESAIDKGMDTAWGVADKFVKDRKDSYNAQKWREGRLKAVKHMLQNPDIASADKGRVGDAVRSVWRYAPKLSQDPALLSGMVNQMVHAEHNAIDPQTISELVKAEKRFREMDSSSSAPNPWS